MVSTVLAAVAAYPQIGCFRWLKSVVSTMMKRTYAVKVRKEKRSVLLSAVMHGSYSSVFYIYCKA